MKRYQALFVTLLAGSLLFSTEVRADLSSDQQHIQDLQHSLNDTNQQIDANQQKQQSLQSEADQLQATIDEINSKMTANQQAIDAKTQEVQDLNAKIAANDKQIHKLQGIFNTQIRTLYEHGSVSYLSVLLDSTSFDDFLSRFDDISMIADSNKKIEAQMEQLKKQNTDQRAKVQADLKETQQKQQELALLQQTNQAVQQQKQNELNSVQSQISQQQSKANALQSEIDFAKQELIASQQHPVAETNAASSSAGTTVALSGGDVSGLVGYAEQFLGTPYVWGGTEPGGFDCSGLTMYVYNHFGIPMNRTSQGQFNQGVSTSDPQPGDLVFFSTYGPGATHVGIYIGSGMFINAEDNGVKISSLSNPYWGPRYIGARHIIK